MNCRFSVINRPLCAFATFLVATFVCNATSAFAQGADEEAAVKAKFVSTFPNYVKDINPAKTACVMGDELVLNALRNLNFKIKSFNQVKASEAVNAELKECSVIFFSNNRKNDITPALQLVAQDRVLTISDHDGFVNDGGIIEVYEKEGRLTFSVNTKKAKQLGLKLDSKLVELADKVI